MRKLSFCLVLLSLCTLTFAGCGKDNSKPIPKKPDSTAPADKADEVDKPADTPADPAVPAAPVVDPAK